MKGHIVKRGQSSWRIKLDVGRSAEGRRISRYRTVRGTKAQAQAQAALAWLLIAHDEGLVEPSKATVAEYMRSWIETAANRADVSPKTAERYRQLIERQIAPRIGKLELQKLKPAHVADWHGMLLKAAAMKAAPLRSHRRACSPGAAQSIGRCRAA
jgi:integrase